MRSGPVRTALLLGVFGLAGLTVRAAFGSVPPLLEDINADLHLSSTRAGLITALMVVSIGLFAPAGQRLAARVGAERAVTLCLVVLGVAGLARLAPWGVGWLYATTVVAGGAMGGASAIVPALIRHHLPHHRGLATGLYSAGMSQGVTLFAALAVPLAVLLGGWRASLATVGVFPLASALVWSLVLGRRTTTTPSDLALPPDHRMPWRSTTARLVTLYFTSQMLVGFACVAWVAPRYVDLGRSEHQAASLFVAFQCVQVVSMFGLPALADHVRDRRPLIIGALCSVIAGLTLMLVAPLAAAYPAVMLTGLGVGGGTALAIILVIDVTSTVGDATRLTAMALLVSNVVGALGPLLLGALRDLTDSFEAGLLVLLAVAVLMVPVTRVYHPRRSLETSPPPSPVIPRTHERNPT